MVEVKKLTHEGLKKIQNELNELKEVKRKQIVERIQEAKEHGDLSENAEYHQAREEQSLIEGRIIELENIIKNSVILEDNLSQDQEVKIGSTLVLDKDGLEVKYTIVGSTEADPKNNLISCDSPLGQALIGRKINEKFQVTTPKGTINLIINKIN